MKPFFAIVLSWSGFFTALLAVLHELTIVVGAAGALLGFAAGVYAYRRNKLLYYRELRVEHPHKRKPRRPSIWTLFK